MRKSFGVWYEGFSFAGHSVSRKTFSALLVLYALVFLCATVTRAQGTADVLGTVTDSSGGRVPGAAIKLTNTGTGITATTQSSGSGEYIFPGVLIGTYTVGVEATGFKTFVTAPFTIAVGDRARVDAEMEVGQQTVTVEVTTAAPALHTDTGSLNTLITSQAVEQLPLDGRNIVKLVWLTAGASQSSSGLASGGGPDDRRQTSSYAVNGQNPFANNNRLDGMDNNEVLVGASAVRPSVDAIQEVNVSTNNYDAQYTKTGGGNVDVITKSGANNFHGSAYEFFRNAVLNANPSYSFPSSYCATGDPTCTAGSLLYSGAAANPPFRQNQYGASLGGPLKKNKTFFFGDFEQFRQAAAQAETTTVPTDCNRGLAVCPDGKTQLGDFSDMPLISNQGGGNNPCVQNGTLACPYVDVAPNQMDPLGKTYFSMYPRANRSGTVNNYFSDPTQTQKSTTFDGRVDQHFSDKDSFFSRYSYNNIETLVPDAFPSVTLTHAQDPLIASGSVTVHPGGAISGPFLPGPNHTREQGLVLSEVHVFSPTLALKLTAGYQRSFIHSLTLNGATANLATKLGFPCNPVSCVNTSNSDTAGIPVASMSGLFGPPIGPGQYTSIGDAPFVPILHNSNTFEYNGVLTWTKGSQSIKFGAVLIRRRNTFGQSNNGRGDFFFSGGYTGVPAADLLEGLSNGGGMGALRALVLVSPQLRSWEPGVFVQDDWRAKKWLTLNLGIRYDIFTPFTEKTGQISNWDPATGLMVSPSLPGPQHSGGTAGIRTNYRNIAPRFGFAASLPHKAVLRGGFGLSFYQDNIGASASMINPPFQFAFNCQAQNGNGTNNACLAPFANGATVNYGPPPSGFSQVGNQGGLLFSAGAPNPVFSVDQVLAPASCPLGSDPASFGCSAAGGNGYANFVFNTAFLPNFPTNYLEVYNLQLEKDFSGNVLTVGYVGNLGRALRTTPYDPTVISNYTQTTNPIAGAYPWLQSWSGAGIQNKWGSNSYQSLQATIARRFKNGLTVNANYTWGHSIWDGQGTCQPTISFSVLGYGNGPKYMNPCYYDNLRGTGRVMVQEIDSGYYNTANSPQDVRHRIAWGIDYDLPFGKSAAGIEGVLIKGWSINTAGSWETGMPFTVGNSDPASTGVGPTGNPDAICSGVGKHSELLGWVNPNCFVLPQANDFGNVKVNSLYGPHQRSADFSLFKDFKPKDWLTAQFRVEVFNLFNTPNFSNPSVGFGCYGSGCSNNPGDKAQLLDPGNPTALQPGTITALAAASTNNAREIQFALKFLF